MILNDFAEIKFRLAIVGARHLRESIRSKLNPNVRINVAD
jgi:hypothetical protein